MKNLLIVCLLILSILGCSTATKVNPTAATAPQNATATTQESSTIQTSEILWDTWGVPHIYAKNEKDLYYGMGWAQMHSHGDLLMKLYAEARGEGAKYFGESALELTKQLFTFDIPRLGKQHLSLLTEEEKMVMNAFVEGINAYAEAHPTHIAENLRGVLPITIADVNGHSLRNLFIEFIGNREMGKARGAEIGSNTWAVSPQRSESGKALLLANPHLRYHDLWLFYEAHAILDGMNLYGSTLVGSPNITIAFNEHLGWSHTVNTLDAADLYRLKLKDDGYLLDGKTENFKLDLYNIPVLQEDGTMRTEKLMVKRSVHGPIVNMGEKEAIALRIARLDKPGNMLDQWKKMGEATSLEEFQAALAQNDLPMFNVMYADKAGNIFYHFAGYTPKRPEGNWDFWSGIVPGDDSKYIWDEYHPYEDLPKLLNPKSGWLQNANDPPYTCTVPTELNPADYPAYMAPVEMGFRPQRAANIMLADDKISFEEFEQYKHDTKMELADRLLDDLLALETPEASDLQKEAFALLKNWNGRTDADAEAALLFANWHLKLSQGDTYGDDFFAEKWSFEKPVSTPDGLKDKAAALQALEVAATEIKMGYGKLNVPWGQVNRVSFGDHDIAGNGGYGWLGQFRTMYYQPMGKRGTPESLKSRAVAGDTYVAIIEFGDRPKAKALLTYGNATQKGNPHIGDQLDLFAQKKLRDVWYERADVEAHVEKREVIARK
ncbi:MAG: acylase [Bacteroidota bacterium]